MEQERIISGRALQAAQDGVVSMFGKHGFNVIFEAGATPSVNLDTKTLTLPVFPEEVDMKTLNMLRGYTDHELGHVIYTDETVPLNKETFAGDIQNVLEDGRIERELGKRYRGCKYNLEYTSDQHESEIISKLQQTDNMQTRDLINALLLSKRLTYGQPARAAARNLEGGALDIVLRHEEELRNLSSTKEARDMSQTLYEELKEYINEMESPDECECEGEGGCEGECSEELIDKVSMQDVGDWMKKALQHSCDDGSEGYTYRAFKDEDRIIVVPASDDNNVTESLCTNIGVAQNKLISILQTEKPILSRYQQEGIIDDRRVGMTVFNEDKIFLKRRRRVGLDSSFCILLDLSASMRYEKIDTAMQMAIFFVRVLEAMHAPCEVLGFTTKGFDSPKYKGYTRSLPVRHYIFKKFEERMGYVKSRFGYFNGFNDEMYHNVDGEAVAWAAGRLSFRQETNKFLFVLSDGQPDGGEHRSLHSEHLKRTVKKVKRNGIHCIGLGMGTDSVTEFYEDHIVMRRDLVNCFINKFRTLVLQVKSQTI